VVPEDGPPRRSVAQARRNHEAAVKNLEALGFICGGGKD
jgi:hypothetical protein